MVDHRCKLVVYENESVTNVIYCCWLARAVGHGLIVAIAAAVNDLDRKERESVLHKK